MTIDWAVVLFEMVNFGVLVLILTRFVVRPVGRVLEQRRADLVERDAQTRAREQQAQAVQQDFERELERIDELAEQRVAAALAEAQRRAETIVSEARTLARTTVSKTEHELEQTRRRTLEQFRREVMMLGVDAARRVIHELGAPELGLTFVRRALHALADRGVSAGLLRIHVSPELDIDEVGELARRELPEARVEVEIDDSLLAGARVLADGHEVQSSAGASLDAWCRGLLADAEATAA